ncbi:WbqC family protein [Thermodesulfobacteriota bacterium]
MKIVILQPMFFPWVGVFEQIRFADKYVHYDDVQFSKGSFGNRVQIKTAKGFKWLSVPLHNLRLGQKIKEVKLHPTLNWRQSHIELLSQVYKQTPFRNEMLELVGNVYRESATTISELAIMSIHEVCKYFKLYRPDKFLCSSDLGIGGKGSQRVLDIIKRLNGNNYITGHGALNYLDHELFEKNGVRVEYIDYKRIPYPQLFGEFNPHVSILDLIANVGTDGIRYINSESKYWKEFINQKKKDIIGGR